MSGSGGASDGAIREGRAALAFVPPVREIGLLHGPGFDRVVEVGYRYASRLLEEADPAALLGEPVTRVA